jgi:hypothetical protein
MTRCLQSGSRLVVWRFFWGFLGLRHRFVPRFWFCLLVWNWWDIQAPTIAKKRSPTEDCPPGLAETRGVAFDYWPGILADLPADGVEEERNIVFFIEKAN